MHRRTLIFAGGLILLCACVRQTAQPSPAPSAAPSATASAPSVAPTASPSGAITGCGPVEVVPPYPGKETLDRTHVDEFLAPALDSYPSVPPASGPHSSTPLPSGAYTEPPSPYEVIHSLEHGAVAIWYDPTRIDEPAATVAGAQWADDHVIVAPFDGATMTSPITVVAWHRSMPCEAFDTAAITDFLAKYRATDPPSLTYEGEAPEPGFPI